MFRRRKPVSDRSWGRLRPSRCCDWEDREREATLLVPRLGRSTVARRVERLFRVRPYRVYLDAVGSYVWRRCDGMTEVSEIARGLRERFGDRIEPAEGRLVRFLQTLVRGRFVSVDSQSPATEVTRPE